MRMGAIGDSGKDACGIANGSNMIFDHVSVSWGRDETFSISGADCNNITIQNSLISQGLLSHSAGGLIQTDGGVTLYRNLYVDNDTRNNKIKGVNQYVNNIVYNWSSGAYIMGGDSEGESFANCVSNYFINGPMKSVNALSGANERYHIYAEDNWWDKNRDGIYNGYLVPQSEYSGGPDFQTSPYNYPVLPTWPAVSLIDSVLPGVGASLPYRDLIDYYVIDELKSFGLKGKIITNETENPVGTPSQWTMWPGTNRVDTDKDGMPDAWEASHGLNPNVASDATQIAANGYLNIENYINSIDKTYSQDFLRAPLCLVADSTTQNSVFLSWFDFTEKEQGYCVEKKINGTYVEIARTQPNGNIYQMTNLNPEEICMFRVRAFNANGYSAYSNELTVKTKPIPVAVLNLSSFTPDLIWSGANGAIWDKNTASWANNNSMVAFTDSAKVLFGNTSDKNISINEAVGIKDMVVNADSSFSLIGSGFISGTGSLNKTGSGTLSLQTNNNYKGATVIYKGTLEVNKLANGGVASSIGASQNYDFNLLFKGGTLNYTGATVSTDRNIKLEGNAGIGVSSASSVLTVNGIINGEGGITKSGAGTLLLKGLNTYEGTTIVSDGKLEINGGAAIENAFSANKTILLNGGYLKTSGGSTTVYENYYGNILVADSSASAFEPYRNCYIYSKVSGNGTLNFNVTYVREYIQGDWSQFSGTVYANGIGTSTDGNQFMLNNTTGIPNARIVTSGNTKIVCWKNASTMYLGGLSGPSGTYLSGADKQNNAATMTWIVGGAGTDETFNGIINNECSNKSYKGTTSIVKEGSGYWKLSGANIYSGTTTVLDGMLIVNGNHTGTGKFTVNDGATLAGKGNIPSQVQVLAGGIIQPGDPTLVPGSNFGNFSVGSLNLSAGSKTNMEINKNFGVNDKIYISGNAYFGGTLNLTITGTPIVGNQFVLFTAASYSGSFSEIIPATPGEGLKWNFSNGVLKVESDANGIEKNVISNAKIYPNPITDNAEIVLDRTYKEIAVCVESLSGSTLYSNTYSNQNKLKLNLALLPKGLYLIKIKTDNKLSSTSKIVKE